MMFDRKLIRTELRLSLLLYLLVLIAFGLIIFSKVDVVVTAVGHLSSDNVEHLVHGARSGYLAEVAVSEGARVARSDLLITYDCKLEKEKNARLDNDLDYMRQQIGKQLVIARAILDQDASKNLAKLYKTSSISPTNALQREAEIHIEQFQQMRDKYDLETRMHEIVLEEDRILLAKVKRELELALEQSQRDTILVKKGVNSRVLYDKSLEAAKQAEEAVRKAKLALKQREFQLIELKRIFAEQRNILEAELYQKLADLYGKQSQLELDRGDLDIRISLCKVLASTSGEILWLSDVSPGRWVSAGELLGKIVKPNNTVLAEALLPESNVAFVRHGQDAIIRINGLPFMRYGFLHAKVTFVSPDTVSGKAKGAYRVDLKIEKTAEWLRRTGIELVPGMAVEVDIIAGKRRVIEYLTDPIQRAFKTAFREI